MFSFFSFSHFLKGNLRLACWDEKTKVSLLVALKIFFLTIHCVDLKAVYSSSVSSFRYLVESAHKTFPDLVGHSSLTCLTGVCFLSYWGHLTATTNMWFRSVLSWPSKNLGLLIFLYVSCQDPGFQMWKGNLGSLKLKTHTEINLNLIVSYKLETIEGKSVSGMSGINCRRHTQ